MLRKTLFALATVGAIGAAALIPTTEASAKGFHGFHGFHHYHGWGWGSVYAYSPTYAYSDYGCWRLRRGWVCNYY